MEGPSKAIHYSWNTPYLDSWKIMSHESLVLWFHGPWNTLRWVHGKFNSLKVLFHGFMAHEILCYKFSWKIEGPWISGHTKFVSKKLPFHRKFMARNKGTKFNFAVFVSHEMPFAAHSLEIHGIFIKMWFIVVAFNKPWTKFTCSLWHA